MCGKCEKFTIVDDSVNGEVRLANQSSTYIKGKGSTTLTALTDGQEKRVSLNNTLFVPELRTNLLSVGKMCDKGYKVTFNSRTADVIDKEGMIVLRAERHNNGLYFLKTASYNKSANVAFQGNVNENSTATKIWHKKMGHLNYRDLAKCIRTGAIRGINIRIPDKTTLCEVCTHGKMTRTPFPKKSSRSTDTLEIVHSDICGPMRSESIGKSKYFITFIDDATRWCEMVRFLKHKNEALQAFKEYKTLVENLNQEEKSKSFNPTTGRSSETHRSTNFSRETVSVDA